MLRDLVPFIVLVVIVLFVIFATKKENDENNATNEVDETLPSSDGETPYPNTPLVITGWDQILHFTSVEFDSPDVVFSGENMDINFIARLDAVRQRLGRPMQINSGYRTAAYNQDLRNRGYTASKNSSHMKGLAADIYCPDLDYMTELLTQLKNEGFTRVGQYYTPSGNYFVHVDADTSKNDALWCLVDNQKVTYLLVNWYDL